MKIKILFNFCLLFYLIEGITFKSNLTIYNNYNNIYKGYYIYSNDINKSYVSYNSPIKMNELNDYNNFIKYKYNNTLCDAVIHTPIMPELYKKETDIKEIIDDKTIKYKRENIELYYKEDKLYKINFDNYEGYIMTYIFENYEEIKYEDINKIEEFKEENLRKCPEPECSNVADIIFMLDESGSISEDDWIKQINFCYDIINKYKIDEQNVKIGIIGFSTFGRIILGLTSSLNNVLSTLDNLKYNQNRGGTCIGCGLMISKSMFENEYINNIERNKLNPKNILIIITDGETTEPTYKEPCELKVSTYTPYNYCKGCCDKENYAVCENKINTCNKTYLNQILELDGNYDCENDNIYNDDNIYCEGCLCKIDKDNKKYLVCDECKEKIKNSYNKCYDYLEIKVCEKDNSISYKKNLSSSISSINDLDNINIISIGVGDFNMEYLKEISKDYSVSSYDDLNNILNNIIKDICLYSNLNEGCEINCKGFCGINKECICPECKEIDNDYCKFMSCYDNKIESTGCFENNIECLNINKCSYSIKNSSNPLCCEYYSNASNCEGNDKCLIYGCDIINGCYSIPKECDDNNACNIKQCNHLNGECEFIPNPAFNCSVEYEGLLMVSNCINISKYICSPAVYRPLCECDNNCYIPYYNNETKLCECIDKNIECELLNNNDCLIGTCINGTCKNIENLNKTYECQNLINEDCYIGFCNITLGKCDKKLTGISDICDECELKGLKCEELNNKCEKYKCEVNETGAYCVKYWEYIPKQNDCLIDYCDPILGINKTKLNSYVKDCILYNCETDEEEYLTIDLCPEFIVKGNKDKSNIINAYKYKCINNTCIKFNNCPLYKDNNKCLIYNDTINDECNYINVDCINKSNKCMNYKCNPDNGLCEEDSNIICENNKCKTSICDINNGCIYKDIYKKEDKCNIYECEEEVIIRGKKEKKEEKEENKKCVCQKIPKCKTNDFCKISYCNIQGKCIYNDYNCEDLEKDECYNYKCNSINKSCDKIIKIERFINYCDKCIKKYGNLLNINKTICLDDLYEFNDFNDSLSSSSSIHYKGFDYIKYVLIPAVIALLTGFIASTFTTEMGKKILTSIGGMIVSFFAKKAFDKMKPEEQTNEVKLFYQPKKEFELEKPDEIDII